MGTLTFFTPRALKAAPLSAASLLAITWCLNRHAEKKASVRSASGRCSRVGVVVVDRSVAEKYRLHGHDTRATRRVSEPIGRGLAQSRSVTTRSAHFGQGLRRSDTVAAIEKCTDETVFS